MMVLVTIFVLEQSLCFLKYCFYQMKQSPQHIQVTLTTHTNTPSTQNKEIRDTHLSRNVLTDPRIKTCGKWINPETYPSRPNKSFVGNKTVESVDTTTLKKLSPNTSLRTRNTKTKVVTSFRDPLLSLIPPMRHSLTYTQGSPNHSKK